MLELQPIDLNVLIKETLELLKNSPQYRAEITIDEACEAQPVMAHVDMHQIRQVLWNLCINALQAMPEGGTLRLKTSAGNQRFSASGAPHNSSSSPCLTIEDTGPGIPENLHHQIFEPFFSTKSYGSGLGLAVVYQIIEAHHGEIHLDSKLGSGTTFHIVLPSTAEALASADSGDAS